MIVVTVGTQLPFDRLIKMIDELAPELSTPVFAQTGISGYVPTNVRHQANIGPQEFEALMRDASVIVAHAGIGTVLKAYKYHKPIILVPRRAALGEHRNDHQLATISQLRHRAGIHAAETKDELRTLLAGELAPAIMTPDIEAKRIQLLDFVKQQLG
ncbi:glucosyl transferase [Aureimonas endophytica]|uniref:Glucosyl transferase n=1 Tax=Aureimonas endophytica TaxID=2027858 RepID=A0A916ZJN4_9HYPH|nr:glycosyltransferase [Aureimonas endophytica]GGE01195.1 glucosyl transferase [Aureimonas endophytica]